MDASDFTLTTYAQLVEGFRGKGYRVTTYSEVVSDRADLILRHDVDMDLDRAVKLADVENRMGIQAHYFVLLRTEMYNVFSGGAHAAVRRLDALGHRVGLHFDASLYPTEVTVLEQAADRECRILDDVLGRRVETITFHRPAPALQGLPGPFAGRLHGYDRRFFSDIGYCSDSEGRWRFGHPLEHEAVRARRAIQLVTHPIWWCALPGEEVVEKLRRLLWDKATTSTREVAMNCKPFKAHMKGLLEEP